MSSLEYCRAILSGIVVIDDSSTLFSCFQNARARLEFRIICGFGIVSLSINLLLWDMSKTSRMIHVGKDPWVFLVTPGHRCHVLG